MFCYLYTSFHCWEGYDNKVLVKILATIWSYDLVCCLNYMYVYYCAHYWHRKESIAWLFVLKEWSQLIAQLLYTFTMLGHFAVHIAVILYLDLHPSSIHIDIYIHLGSFPDLWFTFLNTITQTFHSCTTIIISVQNSYEQCVHVYDYFIAVNMFVF